LESIKDFFELIMNSEEIIKYGGLTLLVLIVFVETGLFFGFFLPGDYLLFTAGLLCGTQAFDVDIFTLLWAVTFAAIAGDFVGYASGRIAGKKLFVRDDSFFFKKRHLVKTNLFFKKYGPQSLVVGRFLPIIRTFAPILAGAANLDLKKFSFYNVFGAFLWVWTLIPLGYFMGVKYPSVIDYLEYIILGFILVTTSALLREYIKSRRLKPRTSKKSIA
jgi:membrane-associated protein